LEQTAVISRRKGREFAMQALYASEVGGDTLDKAADTLMQDDPVSLEMRDYGMRLCRVVRSRADEIDALISACAERWDVARIAVVDRIILRISVAELMTEPDVPAKVCINEAVEIARKFSTENSSRFVNGVLDAVSRKLADFHNEPAPKK
jgi:transcription antitermination protein NusB